MGFPFQLLPGTVLGTASDTTTCPTDNRTKQHAGCPKGEDVVHKEERTKLSSDVGGERGHQEHIEVAGRTTPSDLCKHGLGEHLGKVRLHKRERWEESSAPHLSAVKAPPRMHL